MSSYLVDTNIWSEALRKVPNELVVNWLRKNESSLYVSAVTIGELKFGIELLEEGKRKEAFRRWLSVLIDRMKGRVLSYNTSVATVWGANAGSVRGEGHSPSQYGRFVGGDGDKIFVGDCNTQ
ncbi:MAG: PIN domain-containing protein [Chthoniobacterales bacterium]